MRRGFAETVQLGRGGQSMEIHPSLEVMAWLALPAHKPYTEGVCLQHCGSAAFAHPSPPTGLRLVLEFARAQSEAPPELLDASGQGALVIFYDGPPTYTHMDSRSMYHKGLLAFLRAMLALPQPWHGVGVMGAGVSFSAFRCADAPRVPYGARMATGMEGGDIEAVGGILTVGAAIASTVAPFVHRASPPCDADGQFQPDLRFQIMVKNTGELGPAVNSARWSVHLGAACSALATSVQAWAAAGGGRAAEEFTFGGVFGSILGSLGPPSMTFKSASSAAWGRAMNTLDTLKIVDQMRALHLSLQSDVDPLDALQAIASTATLVADLKSILHAYLPGEYVLLTKPAGAPRTQPLVAVRYPSAAAVAAATGVSNGVPLRLCRRVTGILSGEGDVRPLVGEAAWAAMNQLGGPAELPLLGGALFCLRCLRPALMCAPQAPCRRRPRRSKLAISSTEPLLPATRRPLR